MTEDTKQLTTIGRKARWWLLSRAPSQSFLFLQLELKITDHETAQGSQAMGTSGVTGHTWLPFSNPEVAGIA